MTKFFKSFTITIFLFQLVSVLILRFQGSYHSFYIGAYDFFLDRSSYTYDLFLNNSLLFGSTIYYYILSIIGIQNDNDISLFLIYMLLAGINIFVFTLIIKKFYNVTNNFDIIIYLIPAMILGNCLAPNSQSALFYSHTGTPTAFGFSFILLLTWFTINKRWVLALCFGILAMSFSAKHASFPLLISMVYFLFNHFNHRKIILIIGSVSVVFLGLSLYYFFSIPVDKIKEKVELIDFIISRNQHEDALYLQPWIGILKLCAGFLIFGFTIKLVKNDDFQQYLKILFVLSILFIVFGGLYTWQIYKYFPEPYLVLVSSIKSMALMQLFALIGAIKYISNSKFPLVSKSLLIAALFFGGFGGITGLIISCILILFAVFAYFIYNLNIFRTEYFNTVPKGILNNISITFLVLCLTLPASINTLRNKIGSYAPQMNGMFTIKHTEISFLNITDQLKDCEDFNFLPVDKYFFMRRLYQEEVQSITNPYLVHFSKKSNYMGDPAHLYLNSVAQQKYFKRLNNLRTLFDASLLDSEKEIAWREVAEDNVIMILPSALLPTFFSKKEKFKFHDYIISFPSGKIQKRDFLNHCKLT